MSIISAVIGAVAASSGGQVFTNQASWSVINFSTAQEGQENYFNVSFTDWDGTSTFYYSITSPGNTVLTSQFDNAEGTYVPGQGDSTHPFVFTATADSTTDGAMDYYIRGGSTYFGYNYFNQGAYTIRDSSKTPALVLDLDPANFDVFWNDTSGLSNNASMIALVPSIDNGGVFVFNGTSSCAAVSSLNNSNYGSVTVGAWIKPDAVNVTQTIISKELCYKLNITSNGRIVWMVGSANDSSWTTTFYSGYGLILAGVWAHVMATVDANATKIYINGVLAASSSGVILVSNGQPFNIGTYAGAQGDFFGGRIGEVKMWNYAITATSVLSYYNSTAARYGQTPAPQSLLFNGTQGQPLFVNGNTGDWALGTNGTIEWWEKISSTASSYYGNFNGGILVQGNAGTGLGANGIDIFAAGAPGTGINANIGGNVTTSWPELTTGTWVHVAMSISSGLQQFYYNGIAQTQTEGNRSANLQNALDTLRVGNRVPDQNYQNFTGLISNLHISTATLYTGTFTPMIRTTATTGTVLLLDYYNPTVDLSYYELNNVAVASGNGAYLYISTSTYPNLINQIQIGNTVVANNTSTTVLVTGQVFLADPSNWGVPHSTGLIYVPATVNFSGVRHTTTGTVTLTADAPV